MSRGLGRVELAVLDVLADHPGVMPPQRIARKLLEKHHYLGNAYNSAVEKSAINRALQSLVRKGYVEKVPHSIPLYRLVMDDDSEEDD